MKSVAIFRTLTLAALLTVASFAHAGAAPSAQTFLQTRQQELSALVRQKSEANDKKVEALFDAMLDYQALAKGSLNKHWEERTAAERDEFTELLKALVRRAYRKNLDKTAGYDVAFEGETPVEQGQMVRTVAKSKTNARDEPVSIDYVVVSSNGSWRITDIVTEGSSLVVNYRRQFGRIIEQKGFAELMRRMKNKLGTD